jgi:hypothetical protein
MCSPQTERPQAFLYAFDLLELDGNDMRREPECEVVFRHACKDGLGGDRFEAALTGLAHVQEPGGTGGEAGGGRGLG